MQTEAIQRNLVNPKEIFREVTTDSEQGMPTEIDPDQALSMELDTSELEDSAKGIIESCSLNNTAELLEGMRKDFMSSGYSIDDWPRILPLAKRIASTCFSDAERDGRITRRNGWPPATPLSVEECMVARTSPDLLVEDYLSEDVSLLIGAGGNGKTTLMLYEAICIAGGSELLYGRRILKSGPVIIVTAEDSREHIAARLRELIFDNGLLSKQKEILENIHVVDVGGLNRRLTAIEGDLIVPAHDLDPFCASLGRRKPVLVIFDPAVSFGVGESRVNDSEQGLINAARRIRNSVGCCVRFIHHTGKQNARDGKVDQYAGRGGSAFADGARMVHVLTRLNNKDWFKATGQTLRDDESGLRLVFAKLSFAPQQQDIYIRRKRYTFTVVEKAFEDVHNLPTMIYDFVSEEFSKNVLHNLSSLERASKSFLVSRAVVREVVIELRNVGSLEDRRKPGSNGNARYLHPVRLPDALLRSNDAESIVTE
jgi:hypothetical protein